MSFQEIKKKKKNKLPLQQYFTFHAFHPKAVNLVVSGRSSDFPDFWASFPFLHPEQWLQLLKSSPLNAAGLQLRG